MSARRARPATPPTTPPAIAATGVELGLELEVGSAVAGPVVDGSFEDGGGLEPSESGSVVFGVVVKRARISLEDQGTFSRELLFTEGLVSLCVVTVVDVN